MPGERQWVEQLRPRLETKLVGLSEGASKIRVETDWQACLTIASTTCSH